MRRAAALALALLCATAAAAEPRHADGAHADAAHTPPPRVAAVGAADGVTWLVQLSDLHLSAHAWADRCVPAPASHAHKNAHRQRMMTRRRRFFSFALGKRTSSRLGSACWRACAPRRSSSLATSLTPRRRARCGCVRVRSAARSAAQGGAARTHTHARTHTRNRLSDRLRSLSAAALGACARLCARRTHASLLPPDAWRARVHSRAGAPARFCAISV
jgi:hypothetical protein